MSEKRVNLQVIAWATIIGGFVSSLVKSGTEVNMPPRRVGKISPPAANIDVWLGWLGMNSHSMDDVYQGVTIPGAVVLYHWLFSFVFACVYVLLSAYWPKVRLWYSAAYGLSITAAMHGVHRY
ncbi:Predicted periplasmic/secreted protein [Yersinia pseudotuberculosis]|nr:Predicted periplasmic/secreted protein [Yersinia pseudotuberculosis]